jgi:hypothetical protein
MQRMRQPPPASITGWSSRVVIATLLATCSMAACVSLSPGAAKVQLTKDASDVAKCTSVGQIRVPVNVNRQVDLANASANFRNRVVALRGDTGLVTDGPLDIPVEGVAYRCHETAH